MDTRLAIVQDKDGNDVPAQLIICPDCGGDSFHMFTVGKKHQHLQCTRCDATFCDGSCAKGGNAT